MNIRSTTDRLTSQSQQWPTAAANPPSVHAEIRQFGFRSSEMLVHPLAADARRFAQPRVAGTVGGDGFFRFCSTLVLVLIFFSSLTCSPSSAAQDTATDKDNKNLGHEPINSNQDDLEKEKASKIPAGRTTYLGRRIAQTMHYTGAEWLIRDVREREERCSLMLANLGLKPGMTVCDMGCGNGFHTLPIAKMIGKDGLVVAVDVQPEMLGFLRDRMEEQGIENVTPILGSYHHPRLPPKSIDLVLMVDVYHEFSHPEGMLRAIRNSLKPAGLVVLLEYREEDKSVPIKPLHKMSKAQVSKELEANGFELAKEYNGLPWQHMMFFRMTDDGSGDTD